MMGQLRRLTREQKEKSKGAESVQDSAPFFVWAIWDRSSLDTTPMLDCLICKPETSCYEVTRDERSGIRKR